jgi:hypothetical protein
MLKTVNPSRGQRASCLRISVDLPGRPPHTVTKLVLVNFEPTVKLCGLEGFSLLSLFEQSQRC